MSEFWSVARDFLAIVGGMVLLGTFTLIFVGNNHLPTEKEARAQILKQYPHLQENDFTIRKETKKIFHWWWIDHSIEITQVYLEYPLPRGSLQIAPEEKKEDASSFPFHRGGAW